MTKTFLLMAAMTGIFMSVGALMGGMSGAVMALMIAAGLNVFTYWNADKIVLRMQGAKPADPIGHRQLMDMVERLALRANVPTPKTYIMETDQPNAFATGRNPANAAVAITTGLMHVLDDDEIEAVMAHEMAHVVNRDTLIMTMTATIAGAISMMTNFFFLFGSSRGQNPLAGLALVILAPFAAMIVQMAISRTREYGADRGGAELSGKPLALASALRKIEQIAHGHHVLNQKAEESPAMAHMYIINPLGAHKMDGLFATHPKTANRVAELERMANEMGRGSYAGAQVSWTPTAKTKQSHRGPWGR